MRKSLYSLVLMDKVVDEIDKIAQAQNTNRSNLINQVLAEYASLVTPEKKINSIYNYVNNLFSDTPFVSFVNPHDTVMNIKSNLEYKYHPTVKYSIEIYRNNAQAIGGLKVIFRTQSAELLQQLSAFFDWWMKTEKYFLHNYYKNGEIAYNFDNGKFCRDFIIPDGENYSLEEIAQGFSNYIRMFDEIVKLYLSQNCPLSSLEKKYIQYLNSNSLIV